MTTKINENKEYISIHKEYFDEVLSIKNNFFDIQEKMYLERTLDYIDPLLKYQDTLIVMLKDETQLDLMRMINYMVYKLAKYYGFGLIDTKYTAFAGSVDGCPYQEHCVFLHFKLSVH